MGLRFHAHHRESVDLLSDLHCGDLHGNGTPSDRPRGRPSSADPSRGSTPPHHVCDEDGGARCPRLAPPPVSSCCPACIGLKATFPGRPPLGHLPPGKRYAAFRTSGWIGRGERLRRERHSPARQVHRDHLPASSSPSPHRGSGHRLHSRSLQWASRPLFDLLEGILELRKPALQRPIFRPECIDVLLASP